MTKIKIGELTEVFTSITLGRILVSYNAWNKRVPLHPKIVAGVVSIQIPPEVRVEIETSVLFDVPKGKYFHIALDRTFSLTKGASIPYGIEMAHHGDKTPPYITIHNISDSLVVVNDGEMIARGHLKDL